jgi:hypothetical protein
MMEVDATALKQLADAEDQILLLEQCLVALTTKIEWANKASDDPGGAAANKVIESRSLNDVIAEREDLEARIADLTRWPQDVGTRDQKGPWSASMGQASDISPWLARLNESEARKVKMQKEVADLQRRFSHLADQQPHDPQVEAQIAVAAEEAKVALLTERVAILKRELGSAAGQEWKDFKTQMHEAGKVQEEQQDDMRLLLRKTLEGACKSGILQTAFTSALTKKVEQEASTAAQLTDVPAALSEASTTAQSMNAPADFRGAVNDADKREGARDFTGVRPDVDALAESGGAADDAYKRKGARDIKGASGSAEEMLSNYSLTAPLIPRDAAADSRGAPGLAGQMPGYSYDTELEASAPAGMRADVTMLPGDLPRQARQDAEDPFARVEAAVYAALKEMQENADVRSPVPSSPHQISPRYAAFQTCRTTRQQQMARRQQDRKELLGGCCMRMARRQMAWQMESADNNVGASSSSSLSPPATGTGQGASSLAYSNSPWTDQMSNFSKTIFPTQDAARPARILYEDLEGFQDISGNVEAGAAAKNQVPQESDNQALYTAAQNQALHRPDQAAVHTAPQSQAPSIFHGHDSSVPVSLADVFRASRATRQKQMARRQQDMLVLASGRVVDSSSTVSQRSAATY